MKIVDIMQANPATLIEYDTLGLAHQVMLWRGIRHLPVIREGRVVGVLSERDVVAHLHQIENQEARQLTVGQVMTSPPQTIHPAAPLADGAALMASQRLGCLPVEKEGKLVGIVTNTDLLANLAQYPVPDSNPNALDVSAIMSTKLFAVMPDGFLLDAVATMVRRGVRHLIVVNGLRQVVGMLSDRDIREAVGPPLQALGDPALSEDLAHMKISNVMTPEPRTVRADAGLAAVVAALLADRVGALPVVDELEQLVGVVSYVDALHHLRRQLADPSPASA